ncbi:MAG: hypothetical protein ACNA8W_18905 [Bradymonadaceae bacterium]
MEIRCDDCGHLGPAAEIRPMTDAVGLVCGECGHVNTLDLGAKGAGPKNNAPETPDIDVTARLAARLIARAGTTKARVKSVGEKDMVDWVREHAVERLIPPQGDGLRCRKCANIYSADQSHCTRCGLSIDEAERHPPGEAPWERPPSGKEALFDQANLLWDSASQDWSALTVDKFVEFVRESDLIDMGIRKLQFRLVDEPEEPLALAALASLAQGLEARIIIARSQAQASAEQFQDDVVALRKKFLFIGLGAWTVILLSFSFLFWDKC